MSSSSSSRRAWIGRLATAAAFLVVVVLLLAWLAGAFHRKIGSQIQADVSTRSARTVGNVHTVAARIIHLPRTESAVGTVHAVHETTAASRILARVIEVDAFAGKPVSKDDVLVRLDDADLTARLKQAEAAQASALAARDQARIEYNRVKELFETKSAAKIEWERVQSALAAAEAELVRAEQGVSEAKTLLDFSVIRSPMDGLVIDKKVNPGDTVSPGQAVATLYDPTRMQLIASVRESLTRRLKVGQTIGVRLDAVDHACEGEISEIVPEAESASRSFSVKVTGPCPPGVYSGMFGRLLIPLDEEAVLVIPRAAVRQVGQLDLVDVADRGVVQRRSLQLGRALGDDLEVLSGLREGETVVAETAPPQSGVGP